MRNQRGIGFILSYVSIFISSIVGVAFTPYMISTLGPIEYGLYQLLHATIGYVALLDFGLGSTLTRFILKYKVQNDKENIDIITTMCIRIYGIIAAIVMAIVFFMSFFLDSFFKESITAENEEYAIKLLLIMGATTSISLLSHALSGIQNAYEKYAVTKGIYIFKQLFRVFVIFFLLQLNIGAMAIVIADFFVTVTLAVIDVIYCKVALKSKLIFGKWKKDMFKSLFSFSFFVFLQIIVTHINIGLDRVVLGRFGTLELVALYGVAFQLYSLFNSFGGVIIGITLPRISEVVFNNSTVDVTTDSCAHYSRYQLHILAPLIGGFIVFGKHFISLWAPDYNSTHVYIIALLIVVPQILESTEGTIFNVMKAKNMQATRSVLLICVAIFHIILSSVLVRYMPVYGTAIGTFVSFVLGNNILSNIYYHKKVGVNIFRYFKKLFKGIGLAWIISVLLGFVINLIPLGGWFGFILKGVIYVTEYAVLILLMGINDNEKTLVKKLIEKIRRKSYVG